MMTVDHRRKGAVLALFLALAAAFSSNALVDPYSILYGASSDEMAFEMSLYVAFIAIILPVSLVVAAMVVRAYAPSAHEMSALNEDAFKYAVVRGLVVVHCTDMRSSEIVLWSTVYATILIQRCVLAFEERRVNAALADSWPRVRRAAVRLTLLLTFNAVCATVFVYTFYPIGAWNMSVFVAEYAEMALWAGTVIFRLVPSVLAHFDCHWWKLTLQMEVAGTFATSLVGMMNSINLWALHNYHTSLLSFALGLNFKTYLGFAFGAVRAYRNHLAVIERVNSQWPDATAAELEVASEDKCAICLDSMTAGAKKLSCGHILHAACLVEWFQIKMICPVCRARLDGDQPPQQPPDPPPHRHHHHQHQHHHHDEQQEQEQEQQQQQQPQQPPAAAPAAAAPRMEPLFRFRHNAITNWLPRFTVEVMRRV